MKKRYVLLIPILLSIVMLALAFNMQPVKADGIIYIKPDGSIDPSTAPIQREGNVYTFTANINNTILIEKSSIVLDGAGYTLQGDGSGTGVATSFEYGASSVTIKNIEIKNFSKGVILQRLGTNTVFENNIINNYEGIYLDYSFVNNISNNNIAYNSVGIRFNTATNSIFSGNNITDNGIGLHLFSWSKDNKFYHNNFMYNTQQVKVGESISDLFDDGYPSGGNYWSDYSGNDLYSGLHQNETSPDCVGDVPHIIDGNIQDNYPLLKPWLWDTTHFLTNITCRDNSGTVILNPTQITALAPNGRIRNFSSFTNQWLESGSWILTQIIWQGSNVKPPVEIEYDSITNGTWNINCRVYSINFTDSFKDNTGTALYAKPSSFMLTFPNGTSSTPLAVGTYLIQNGTTTWDSVIWQGTEVSQVPTATFDATNGNPVINCRVYSLVIDPVFYDKTGTTLVHPSSWSIEFPNGTIRTVSSSVTYNQLHVGNYSIISIVWERTEVVPDIVPVTSLTSNVQWSPNVNCLLPTKLPISLSSSTSYVGFKVEINGNLTCNKVGLSGAPILLSYSVTRGESWNDITLVNTASDGSYSAVWMLPATGNYLVRAIWSGNATYPGTTTIINLAVTPFKEQNVFSVTSNSTVSELVFNSTSRELSFSVAGPPGTTGYVNVYIAKSLIDNIEDVKVYLDGDQVDYTATSLEDSWHLHFTYRHSTHTTTISLGPTPFIPPQLTTPLGLGILAAVLAVATLILILKMRKGTTLTILDDVFRKTE